MKLPAWIHSDRSFLAFLAVLAGLTVTYLAGLPAVPFHPDESTQLFMSADIERMHDGPRSFFWQSGDDHDPVQLYHLLDAPLTRYALGLARQAIGLAPLPVDWDWGKSWTENEQGGALPSEQLLLAGRLAVALAYPFSVLALFLATRRVSNDFTAWNAALMLATHALILLHTRRAMAESLLVLTTTLTLWSLVRLEQRRWLAGIPAALAFCAKQSLVALAPVGLLAALWPVQTSAEFKSARPSMRHFLFQGGRYIVLFVLVVFLLNPFMWRQPYQAGLAALRARQALVTAQTTDRAGLTLDSPGLRLLSLVGGLYLTPPVFHEVGNYAAETSAAEQSYLANPLNNLLRSIPAGGILLLLGLLGFAQAGKTALQKPISPKKRGLILLLLASLFQILFLLATVPLPWQRYYIGLVPIACIWQAFGLDYLRVGLASALSKSKAAAAERAVTPK